MNAGRVDALVDLAYGVLIFVSVVLIAYVGTTVGAAFGFGVLASYAIHVVWKMARFDPDWMTKEATEEMTEEVTENVERTVEDQFDEVTKQLEQVNERIDRRPKSEEFERKIDEVAERVEEETENPNRGSSTDGDSSNGSRA